MFQERLLENQREMLRLLRQLVPVTTTRCVDIAELVPRPKDTLEEIIELECQLIEDDGFKIKLVGTSNNSCKHIFTSLFLAISQQFGTNYLFVS